MSEVEGHLGETLQDIADDRLSGMALAQANSHLDVCARCRRELEALHRVKRALAPPPEHDVLPPALSRALSQQLDREDGVAVASSARPRTRATAVRQWALAAGVAAAVAVSLLLWRHEATPNSWTAAVAEDFAAYRSARLPLGLRTADPAELERFFATQGLGFAHVFDLGMMNYRIEGGEARRAQDRPSALSVYRGPDDERLLCEMFRGRMSELPAATRSASHNGTTFQVYSQGALTAVFWAEGDVICVLVSDIDSEALLALAFAKAGPAV